MSGALAGNGQLLDAMFQIIIDFYRRGHDTNPRLSKGITF
ncbi:hypothetical protein PFWH6_2294 [Pseudomonas fluorescens WH6]|nr:hypothetical protein PFWH6_2294 [Pseudomonas fluorescens WH6]